MDMKLLLGIIILIIILLLAMYLNTKRLLYYIDKRISSMNSNVSTMHSKTLLELNNYMNKLKVTNADNMHRIEKINRQQIMQMNRINVLNNQPITKKVNHFTESDGSGFCNQTHDDKIKNFDDNKDISLFMSSNEKNGESSDKNHDKRDEHNDQDMSMNELVNNFIEHTHASSYQTMWTPKTQMFQNDCDNEISEGSEEKSIIDRNNEIDSDSDSYSDSDNCSSSGSDFSSEDEKELEEKSIRCCVELWIKTGRDIENIVKNINHWFHNEEQGKRAIELYCMLKSSNINKTSFTEENGEENGEEIRDEIVEPNVAEIVEENIEENREENIVEIIEENGEEIREENIVENVAENGEKNVAENVVENIKENVAENVVENIVLIIEPNVAENVVENGEKDSNFGNNDSESEITFGSKRKNTGKKTVNVFDVLNKKIMPKDNLNPITAYKVDDLREIAQNSGIRIKDDNNKMLKKDLLYNLICDHLVNGALN
jgi:hypothetical protein